VWLLLLLALALAPRRHHLGANVNLFVALQQPSQPSSSTIIIHHHRHRVS
jgi:hypothetical protein